MTTNLSSCYCIGPQNGQPLCPCMMRNVKVIDGRYVRVEDLGPVLTYGKRDTRTNNVYTQPDSKDILGEKS